jgi:hypothetical protein
MHTSMFWLLGAAALTSLTVAVARQLLGDSAPSGWQSLIGHLLVALPLLALAAYCARESSRYRENSRWSGRLAVQLKSISAYCDRLDDDDRRKLLTSFGLYVFGPHFTDRAKDNQLNAIPPEVWSALGDTISSKKKDK